MSELLYKFLVSVNCATPEFWMQYSTGCIAFMLVHVDTMFLLRIFDKEDGESGFTTFKNMFGEFNPLFPKNRAQVRCIGITYLFLIFILPFSMIAFLRS